MTLAGPFLTLASLHTLKPQNEGQHVQHVFPTDQMRTQARCAPFHQHFCLPLFLPLLLANASESALQLEKSWAPYWTCRSQPCTARIEKDPDLGSLLAKAMLFPRATIIAVMRHPFSLRAYDGFYRTALNSTWWGLARWNEVWPHFVVSLSSFTRSYAFVRYEALKAASEQESLQALSPYTYLHQPNLSSTRRQLPLHKDRVIGSMFWSWTQENDSTPLPSLFLTHPEWPVCEALLRQLTGYSLAQPEQGSESELLICSGNGRRCDRPAFLKLAGLLDRILKRDAYTKQARWVRDNNVEWLLGASN